MSEGPGPEPMSEVTQTTSRLLRGLVFAYGVYVVLYGHLTPGGGFAGGVVVACGFVLVVLAEGRDAGLRLFPQRAASTLDCVGVLLFLAIASAGALWAGREFFANFIATPDASRHTLPSGGIIPLANIGIGLKVASSLFLVFVVLAALRVGAGEHESTGDEP